ncbi:phosphotransferase family protein [Kribbia dieselivorans]|uniref:phosphotransferase family protein n=1 Tax=Kribbia dieselivorans TaxID=331526 RepID=UPI00083978C6|nr:phosphotransferase family protein [Kribbia dieselivorans]
MNEPDPEAMRSRLDGLFETRWPGARTGDLRRLPGGVSSLTYLVSVTGLAEVSHVVVKVAPPGLAPVRNRDVLRQARLMRALGSATDLRLPEVLLEEDGDPPLFVMTRLVGDSYEPLTDVAADPPSPAVVRERAFAAAGALAAMQAVLPEELGLGDEPVLTPADELAKWAALFDTVDDDICPTQNGLRARLESATPELGGAVVTHGDFRLGNMIFEGSDLSGVIDWEIWGVGDQRHDVAWLVMHADPVHRFHDTRPEADVVAGRAMPSPAEMLDAIVAATGRGSELLPNLGWFLALNQYKVASTVGVLAKRNRRAPHPRPDLVAAAQTLSVVVERGHDLLDRGMEAFSR